VTRQEILDFVWQAVALFGGAGVIAATVAAFVAKTFADRSIEKHKASLEQETERLKSELGKDLETHKWKLKRNEIIFAKQLAAAEDFFELHRKLRPTYSHPDMDWHEARHSVLDNFGRSERHLEEFIAKHGPVLSDETRTIVQKCRDFASNEKFANVQGGYDARAEDVADQFLNTLEKAEHQFVKEIRGS
jgi:hypothetical protein